MANINLLPPDLIPKSSVIKFSNLILNLVYGGIALFLVLILGLVSLFILNSAKTKSLTASKNQLETVVKSYQETEQQMVLAKDRLGKINDIWKKASADKGIDALTPLTNLFSAGVNLNDVKITAISIEATVTTASNQLVTQFLSTLISSKFFTSIFLKSFTYNPSMGYSIGFNGNIK